MLDLTTQPTYLIHKKQKGRLKILRDLFRQPKSHHIKIKDNNTMNEQDLDLDNLDNLLEDFDGVTVEGGVDSENDDGCEGGACKI